MRRLFAELLLEQMRKSEVVHVVTADMGFGMFDAIWKEFPTRFHNVGAAEQLMVGVAVGLAISGYIPVCYSITPFLLFRPYEMIRLYVNHEKIPVKLVGSGRGRDYGHDGYTHWSQDDAEIVKHWENLKSYWPLNKEDLKTTFPQFLYSLQPWYLNLSRQL